MNFRTRSFLVLLTMIIFTLISCSQNDDRSSSRSSKTLQEARSVTPLCDGEECPSIIDWKIYLQGKSFPSKVRLEIDEKIVLDECLSKQRFSIKRFVTPQVAYLDNYSLPSTEKLKIKVVDLGESCDSEETFIYDESAPFEIKKIGNRHFVVVDL